jgi:hypothetical protein
MISWLQQTLSPTPCPRWSENSIQVRGQIIRSVKEFLEVSFQSEYFKHKIAVDFVWEQALYNPLELKFNAIVLCQSPGI